MTLRRTPLKNRRLDSSVSTHSSDTDFNPRINAPDDVPQPPPAPDPPNESEGHRQVCGYMPDRCD